MSLGPGHDLTALLEDARDGRPESRERLTRAIYGELRRIAARLMRRERPGHTLQPSALVHEALIRLFAADVLARAPDRQYLFAAAARAMRQILVDYHRRQQSVRRGRGKTRRVLEGALRQVEDRGIDVLALDEALDRLAALEPRQCLVVTFRFFLGMSEPEVAEALGVSRATVQGDWRLARAWLLDQFDGGGP